MPLLITNSSTTDRIYRIPDDTPNGQTPDDDDVQSWDLPASDPRGITRIGSNVYVGNSTNRRIFEITLPETGDANVVKTIHSPSTIPDLQGLANYNSNLYIGSGRRIYVVSSSEISSTTDGNEFSIAQTINTPSNIRNLNALTISSSGRLYIADSADDRIYHIDLSSLTFTNDEANPANSDFSTILFPSALTDPGGLGIDADGNLFVADFVDDAVYVILSSTGNGQTATIQRTTNLPSAIKRPVWSHLRIRLTSHDHAFHHRHRHPCRRYRYD